MSAANLTVSAPKIEDRQFTKPLLCGPGPCDLWPSVAEALTRPVLSPICDEFFNVMDDIRAGLRYVFQTQSKLVLAMSGSGHSGMEAIISNLVAPGETLLIASRGIWEDRALNIAIRYGIKTAVTSVPFNTTFSSEQLERAIKRVRPAAIFITQGDSSTGTVQNLKGIGDICHKYGVLLLVDTVVSLAAEPFFMDEWKVDGVYSSTQKALSGPAGISPVAFSTRAEQRIKNRKHEPPFHLRETNSEYLFGICFSLFRQRINNRKHEPPFYFDIKLLAQQWNCYGNTRMYHHTMSPPLLWALRRCLEEVICETLPKSWERHAVTQAHFLKRLEQLSLQLLVPKPEDRLVTVTTVVLPKGYDYVDFIKYMRANHNILIFGGLGPTVGKALRIGIMGVNGTTKVADDVADAMADTLRALTKCSL